MIKLMTFLFVLFSASSTAAQVSISFSAATDPSGFISPDQKILSDTAKDLTRIFTKSAKKDRISVVSDNADVTIIVTKRVSRIGGVGGMYARAFAGNPTTVELRKGDYTTTLEGRSTPLLAKVIRQWLADNRQKLEE